MRKCPKSNCSVTGSGGGGFAAGAAKKGGLLWPERPDMESAAGWLIHTSSGCFQQRIDLLHRLDLPGVPVHKRQPALCKLLSPYRNGGVGGYTNPQKKKPIGRLLLCC